MSKRAFIIISICLTLCLGGLFSANIVAPISKAEEHVSFYSVHNSPIFYGATKITIDKNVIDKFDPLDARFRIFAKDFEDGDLTPSIECVFNNVIPNVEGEYAVKYQVVDSHNNKTEISVPVIVTSDENRVCKIERTLYTMPSLWNMSLVGTERCNNGDSQIMGIFLPKGSSAKVRLIEGDKDLKITFLTNTRSQNSFASVKAGKDDYTTLQNIKNNVSYDGVPLITTPRLNENNIIDKTYKIEVVFERQVKELDYYHYKDSEEVFQTKWSASGNSFGVVDGEAMMVVVPFFDKDKISNYNDNNAYNCPIGSLDDFFEYILEVVERMDKMIGLEFDAKNALDQNFRTKCLIVADAGYGSGAYYMGTFIGISSASVAAAFQYGWGTLHEIAHGYQGTLGQGANSKGSLYLNETGNNILAHYIQMDRTLYKKTDSYIGALSDAEQKMNESRKSKVNAGKTIFNNENKTYTNTHEKLYCIVNLFDNFEGTVTYGKLFKYFRKIAYEKGVNAYSIADVYAKFFADEYGANVIPYLKSWTMDISSETCREIMERALPAYAITADFVGHDNLERIKQNNNITLNYGLIDEHVVRQENIFGDLELKIEIDNFNKLKGESLGLFYKNRLVQMVVIKEKEICLGSLPAGTYEVRMPTIYGYDNSFCMATIGGGENKVTHKYSQIVFQKFSTISHQTSVRIYGINNTLGYTLDFSDNYSKAKITLGPADMGNRTNYWKNKADEVFISVVIKNNRGKVVSKVQIKGGEYFINQPLENAKLDIKTGYKIVVSTFRPGLVKVYSLLTQNQIKAYTTVTSTGEMKTQQNIEFEVTAQGLKLCESGFDERNVLYEEGKGQILKIIEDYKLSATDDELSKDYVSVVEKAEVINAFNFLDEEDKLEYASFVERIKAGGKPTITAKQDKYVLKKGAELNINDIFSIVDNEDGEISLDDERVKIETNLDLQKDGKYYIYVSACDKDGNISTKSVEVVVINWLKVGTIIAVTVACIIAFGIVVNLLTKKRHKKKYEKRF